MKIIQSTASEATIKPAIVVSRFNQDITSQLLQGALQKLKESSISDNNITVVHVPGAVEIPFAAQQLAKTQNFNVIITLGAVIYGETDHYHYVCEQVSQGCQRVMLDEGIPTIFGVMTVRTMQQALARTGGEKGNMGADVASAAIEMISVAEQIQRFSDLNRI